MTDALAPVIDDREAAAVVARRIRIAAIIALAALPLFAAADLWGTQHWARWILANKLAQLVVAVWTYRAAGRATTWPQVESIALVFVSGLIVTACAAAMAVGSMVNASLVEKRGLKRISHSALCALIAFAIVHFAVASLATETILIFVVLQGLTMGAMSLTTSNFSAVAMEKVGHVAGTASSIQGVATMVGGALISAWIGQHWTGHVSLLPLSALICGLIALSLVAAGERGKLFRN